MEEVSVGSSRGRAFEGQLQALRAENEELRRQLRATRALMSKQEEELKTRERDARAFHLKFARTSQELLQLKQDYALLEGESIAALMRSNKELEAKTIAQNVDYEKLKRLEEHEKTKLATKVQMLEQTVAAKEKRIQDLDVKTKQRIEDMQLVVQRVQASETQLLQSNHEYLEAITRLQTQLENSESQVQSASTDIALFQEALRHKEDFIRLLQANMQEKEVQCSRLQSDLHEIRLLLKATKEAEAREKKMEPTETKSLLVI